MNKKLYFTLWAKGTLATALVMPYLFSLRSDMLEEAPVSPLALAIIGTVQTAILLAIAVYVGLRAAKSVGLKMPYMEAALAGEIDWPRIKWMALRSAVAGAITGLAIVALDFVFGLFMTPIGAAEAGVPLFYRFLASFYGGITEELFMRLFLMSGIVWLLTRFAKGMERNNMLWTAIFLTAIIFGLGHLPVTASIAAITPLVVVRAIVLNGVGGVVFGWLYAKRGLESAMVAHFAADIVLRGLLPFVS